MRLYVSRLSLLISIKTNFCVVMSFLGIRIFLKGENLLIFMFLVEYRSLKRKSIHKSIFAAALLGFAFRGLQ